MMETQRWSGSLVTVKFQVGEVSGEELLQAVREGCGGYEMKVRMGAGGVEGKVKG